MRRSRKAQFTASIALCLLALMAGADAAHAQQVTLRVAAAADLKPAMQTIASQFEKQSGMRVDVTYGSSGNFFSQVQSGAPFDIFFSADAQYPKLLEAAGLAEPGTLHIYAVGRIAIWMPSNVKSDPARERWDALLDTNVKKIAIANPEHAPYGRAAVAALQKAGIYERVKAKLVFGENISQAAQFVQSGNAQAGIVAMSLVLSFAMKGGRFWEIPSSFYPPIEQVVVVIKNSRNKEAAESLAGFVSGPVGKEILVNNGFWLPSAATAGTVLP